VNSGGFQPDLVWVKERTSTSSHALVDSVRGVSNLLSSNLTDAEATGQVALTSFNSNGFTVGYDGKTNESPQTYVGWQWKANGAGVSNDEGSITSTVSANTTSGFSIVTWTNPSSGVPTIGHGLGDAPTFIIVKDRTYAYNWDVGCDAIGWANRLNLNTTGTTSSGFWNSTAPTSTVFTYAASGANSGDNIVAYCFSEVPGYSKFGSYTGNGSTDGPFVYLGFRPAWIMIKRTDTSGYYWWIVDTARNTYNALEYAVYAQASDAETTGWYTDSLANGFKIRGSGAHMNTNGGTYIYMAFAENPFKNSLAR
jgi:hypothetical protein